MLKGVLGDPSQGVTKRKILVADNLSFFVSFSASNYPDTGSAKILVQKEYVPCKHTAFYITFSVNTINSTCRRVRKSNPENH
jgi:hypothetical protein